MTRRGTKSTFEAIREFLQSRGARGATLREIYDVTPRILGRSPSKPTIRGEVTRRVPTAKRSLYRKTLERVVVAGEVRYRLISRGRRS